MPSKIFFSIIIPIKEFNDYLREAVPHIQTIGRDDWELIIIPNEKHTNEWGDKRVKIFTSGRVGPSEKRDIGAKEALGEILVFMDDDSYPKCDFLDIAEQHFEDKEVVALGGPGITPSNDSFFQKVSGAVFLSKYSGGAPERYIPYGNVRPVEDWPSVNLMVRKNAFFAAGGFDYNYWPGEDTKFCKDLIQNTKKKILYIPTMCVWHHRRSGLIAHLKQVGAYGLHRGFFSKRFPETLRQVSYFIPSALTIFTFLSLILPLFFVESLWFIIFGWLIYSLALAKACFDMRRFVSWAIALAALGYVLPTHLWYGVRFLQGLFTTKLKPRLR